MQECLAEYLRLSLEDDDILDESNSITNQRIILQNYVAKHKEFEKYRIVEFKDDGYTGTNFDRPAFQKMMDMVRDGQIAVILVKDLSRFGRNHIEVGTYLEQIFPFLGIRFVAVNDAIDSKDYLEGIPDADVSFRNIVNEYYSHDISVKIKSSLVQKRKQGQYMGARAPYGYLKPKDNVTSLIVNPETAPIVQKIFKMFLEGYNLTQLARKLNEEGIMCPGRYKREVLHTGVKKVTENDIWYPTTVRLILTSETYLGTVVGGKYHVECVGSKKHILNDEEEWIKVEDVHEAIIDRETFDAVQAKLEKYSRKKVNVVQRNYPLKGLVFCGGCGQKLVHIARCRPHFICPRKFNALNDMCVCDNIYEEDLNSLLFSAICKFALLGDKAIEIIEEERKKLHEEIRRIEKQQKKKAETIDKKKQDKADLYTRFALDEISQSSYEQKSSILDNQIEEIEKEIASIGKVKEESVTRLIKLPDKPDKSLESLIDKSQGLTEAMAKIFIKRINIWDDKRIEIQWNFNDMILNEINRLEKIESAI